MSIFSAFVSRLQKLIYEADLDVDTHEFIENLVIGCLATALVAAGVTTYMSSITNGYVAAIVVMWGLPLVVVAWLVMKSNKRTEQIEEMLPNFLSMMASNIRSGVTYDRALLLSGRKEFGPLAREIERAAKQTLAGKPLNDALMEMAHRTRSEMVAKTMRLIVEGMNAGGNLAEMLEITAIDIRQSSSLKKEVSATVLVYRLFIFVSATIGAPLLYALTGFLIEVFVNIRANASIESTGAAASQLPMLSSGDVISPSLFFMYALVAIGTTALFSALASGVITKGKESDGLPDLGWTLIVAYGIFFSVRFVFGILLGQLLG